VSLYRPGFAALESAAFCYPPVERKEDSAAGGCTHRIPSLTVPALNFGAPSIAVSLAAPLGSARHQ
jgi:hypothetical protein